MSSDRISGGLPSAAGSLPPDMSGIEEMAPLARQLLEQTFKVVRGSEQNSTLASRGPGAPLLEAPKHVDQDQMALMFMELQSKLQDEQIRMSQTDIKANLDSKKAENTKMLEKLKEAADKFRDQKTIGLFQKIFGWISAIGMLIIAAAATLATRGAAAPLLVGALVGLAMMIDQETGGHVMGAITKAATAMYQAFGLPEKEAKLAAAITVGIAVVAFQLILAVAGAALSGGSSLAALPQALLQVGAIINGVVSIASGSVQVASSAVGYEASMKQADAKELEKLIAKLQAMMEDETERLKKMLDDMQEGVSVVMQIMAGQAATKSCIIQQQGV